MSWHGENLGYGSNLGALRQAALDNPNHPIHKKKKKKAKSKKHLKRKLNGI